MRQSQINPHFLYNVLHTISLKAKLDGNEDIHHMASSFAKLTQARLSHNADDKITLEQELQYVKFYLDLQKYRFEEKLQYYIMVQNNDLLHYTIPRLTVEWRAFITSAKSFDKICSVLKELAADTCRTVA